MPLDLVLVLVGFAALALGYPVAITLGGTAILVALLGVWIGGFDAALLMAIPSRVFGIITSPVLLSVPFFIVMGVVVERAGLANDLFSALARALSSMRGGLSLAVLMLGTVLAAATGVVGASVVTLGLLALPALVKARESPARAGASIAAIGTLGQIVPPAIVLIVLADQMSNAWQTVQLERGNFAPETISVSDFFAAALVPGLLLAALYGAYLFLTARRDDRAVVNTGEAASPLRALAPVLLVALVLGSILTGFATPAEAAAIGAAAAVLLAVGKGGAMWPLIALLAVPVALVARPMLGENAYLLALPAVIIAFSGFLVALVSLVRTELLSPILRESLHLTSMIFLIVIGASIFALVFRGLGGDARIAAWLGDLPGGAWGALLLVLALIFLLGFVMEFIEITYLVVPIVVPALLGMTFADGSTMDPLWLGIAIALTLQTSFLTPPFGVALFYLKGVAPPEMTLSALYRAVIPFVGLQGLAVILVLIFPALTLAFPAWLGR